MRPYAVMTLSFHRRLLSGELSLAEFVRELAARGIEGLEPATSLFTGRPELVRELAVAAADEGLSLPAYDALANLISPDPADRRAADESLRRDLDLCHRLGIPLAMVAGSRRHPDLSPTDCRRQVAEGMNALADEAEAAGVTLLLESFGVALDVHAASADLHEVVDQCDPRVRITFDLGNYVLGGDRPSEVLPGWLDRLGHVHVKDFRGLPAGDPGGLPSLDGHRYAGCRLGQGSAEVAAVIAGLRQAGYAGALSLELGGADGFDELAADLAVLRGLAEA